jgi:hypothetical protein
MKYSAYGGTQWQHGWTRLRRGRPGQVMAADTARHAAITESLISTTCSTMVMLPRTTRVVATQSHVTSIDTDGQTDADSSDRWGARLPWSRLNYTALDLVARVSWHTGRVPSAAVVLATALARTSPCSMPWRIVRNLISVLIASEAPDRFGRLQLG